MFKIDAPRNPMNRSVFAAVIVCVAALAGCGYYSNGEFGPQDQRDYAKHFVSLFAKRDTAAIEKELDPHIDRAKATPAIEKMFALYPNAKPTTARVYNWTETVDPSGTFYRMEIQYEFPGDKVMVASVVLENIAGRYAVYGVHFQEVRKAWRDAVAFRLSGKTAWQYAFLALTIAAVLFSLLALVLCIRTRGVRRKWLWIIFIIIGFGKLGMNWATGEIVFQPLAFQLFSASVFTQGVYQPWFLWVSLPLGAIIFLARRKQLIYEADVAQVATKQAENKAADT